MPPATKVKPEPQTEPKTHVFYSRSRNLRLPRVKQRLNRDAYGEAGPKVYFHDEKGREITRCVYEFQNGSLSATDGEDRFPDGPDGEWQDKVQWLRRHEEFNGLFHEHGNEPDRPLPTDEDFHKMLRRHLVNLDLDAVVAMLQTERETHARQPLLSSADDTRREILEHRQRLEQEPA